MQTGWVRFFKSEPSIVKFIENQSEHLSKLTLYHLKNRATRRSRRARKPSRIPLLFLRGLNKKNSMLKKFVFKKISTIEIPKCSKLHRYVNKTLRSVHFGVVVVELMKCKCGGMVKNEIW